MPAYSSPARSTTAPNNLAEFDRLFAINVGGVAAAVRAAAPLISDGGRIISIGSVVGDTSPFPGIADYSATKGAVAAYTRGWARDLGPRGITVNNVQPGPIDTDMNPAANGEFSANAEVHDGAWPLRHAGGGRGGGCVPGQPRGELHHRRQPQCGRRHRVTLGCQK